MLYSITAISVGPLQVLFDTVRLLVLHYATILPIKECLHESS